jgi:hypothetical protein
MEVKEFSVSVLYSQLAVFDPVLERPFNMWTIRHVDQGFAWRPGSVAFRTLQESGRHLVTVKCDHREVELMPDAVRTIEVPFEIPPGAAVEIGSISDSTVVYLPSGLYQLRYDYCRGEGGSLPKICLFFKNDTNPRFDVIRADDALRPGSDLLKSASPA